jgi:hypothetical protein
MPQRGICRSKRRDQKEETQRKNQKYGGNVRFWAGNAVF